MDLVEDEQTFISQDLDMIMAGGGLVFSFSVLMYSDIPDYFKFKLSISCLWVCSIS